MNTKTKGLFQRDFTLVVVGQVISLFGNAIIRFALPLYLLRETDSSALFGAVNASSFIPMIVFSLLGGVLADRLNKRNIMVFLDFGTAGLILAFYLARGRLPLIPLMIVCLMMLYGIFGAYQPAVQASIPALAAHDITRANAVINMVNTLSGLLGPVIGGILFGIWGIAPILVISIACFFCSAVMELFICIPYERQKEHAGIISIVKKDLKLSWQYIKNEKPVFLSVVVLLSLFNLVLSAAMIVGIPVMIIRILGMSDIRLGITQGALGLGGLMGGVLAGLLGDKLKIRNSHWLLGSCSAGAVIMGIALFPGMPPAAGYLMITLVSFGVMAASALFAIQMCATVQKQTPANLIGKIMAFVMAVSNCASPLGQALYGVLFDLCREFPWMVLFGSALAAFCISLCSKPVFIRLEKEDREAAALRSAAMTDMERQRAEAL